MSGVAVVVTLMSAPRGSSACAVMVADSSSASPLPRYALAHCRIRTDLGRRALGDHAPEVDHDDPVAGGHHEVDVVLDEQHAHAPFVGERAG